MPELAQSLHNDTACLATRQYNGPDITHKVSMLQPTQFKIWLARISNKVERHRFIDWFHIPTTMASFEDLDALVAASFFDHVTSLNTLLAQ